MRDPIKYVHWLFDARGGGPFINHIFCLMSFLKRPHQSSLFTLRGGRMVFIAVVAGYYLTFALFPYAFRLLGLTHNFGWFFDSYAILASSDAAAAGLDPYKVNPLDLLGRPHVYSRLWLDLSHLGFTRADNFLMGGAFVVMFFMSALIGLRPKSGKEAAWYVALLASPAVVLAVERGNNDLLMFAIMAAVIALLAHQREWVRWLSLLPLLAATALKFYPAAAVVVVVMVGRSRRELWSRGLVAGGLIAGLFYYLRHDFAVLGPILPRPEGMLALGAPQVFHAMGLSWTGAVLCGQVLGGLGFAVCWRLPARPGSFGSSLYRERGIAFMLGAVLLTACFFAGANFAYRYVYGLMLAPLLWELGHDAGVATRVRRLAGITLILLVLSAWFDGAVLSILACFAYSRGTDSLLALADKIALCRQPLHWALMVCLLWFIAQFAREAWSVLRTGKPLVDEPSGVRFGGVRSSQAEDHVQSVTADK